MDRSCGHIGKRGTERCFAVAAMLENAAVGGLIRAAIMENAAEVDTSTVAQLRPYWKTRRWERQWARQSP